MAFLVVGIALLLMKYLEYGPVANWSWWIVLLPFGLAAVWWEWADWSGYSKRKAMEKLDKRKAERQAKLSESLGLGPRRK